MNTIELLAAVTADLNNATAILAAGGYIGIELETSLLDRAELVNKLVDLCLDRPAAEERALMLAMRAVENFAGAL